MSHKHKLCFDVPDTSCPHVLKIIDASIYDDSLNVECIRLDVYLPGSVIPIYITDFDKDFNLSLSAVDLKLQDPGEDTTMILPDGIYKIRYSVSPNEYVYKEKYHLRTTLLDNQYYHELCKIQLESCEPTKEQHEKLHNLRYIRLYIDAAKAKAEHCDSPLQAVDMMLYAERLLNKINSNCCLTCKK